MKETCILAWYLHFSIDAVKAFSFGGNHAVLSLHSGDCPLTAFNSTCWMRYIGVSASVDSCSSCTLLPELYKWKVWLAFNFFFLKSFLRPKPTCQPGYKRSSRDPEKPVLCSHSQHTICPQGMLLGFVPALAVLPC